MSSVSGKGLFTSRLINKGEVVIIFGGAVFSRSEVDAGMVWPDSIISIDEGLYLADPITFPQCKDDFLNHSCDSNLWLRDELTVIARRPIDKDEELTMDYALFEGDEDYVACWDCQCGSVYCRKKITGRDWLLPEVQARYHGHFSPFINKRISKLKKIRSISSVNKTETIQMARAF